MTALLDIENLRVSFPTHKGRVEVVKGLSFTLGRERLGIVGESGSGKSMTGRSILKLIAPPGSVTADRLDFDGVDILAQSPRKMRKIRGARISMVMQDPKFSLNPVLTIGAQIGEALAAHFSLSRREIRERSIAMLESVRIDDPERVMGLYPHEVSGGMGQRVMIAMMLIPEPDLLIADEPTSALDVSVQGQVLDIMDRLVRDKGMGLIFISHDLDLVSRYCDPHSGDALRRDRRGMRGLRAFTSAPSLYARAAWRRCRAWTRTATSCRCWNGETRDDRAFPEECRYFLWRHQGRVRRRARLWRRARAFALVGESGSGKSTILRAIAGLAPDWTGDISPFSANPRGKKVSTRISPASARWCFRTPTARSIRARPLMPRYPNRWRSTASETARNGWKRCLPPSALTGASGSAFRTSFPAVSASAWRLPAR